MQSGMCSLGGVSSETAATADVLVRSPLRALSLATARVSQRTLIGSSAGSAMGMAREAASMGILVL